MAEIKQLFTREDDFCYQTADLIHISRTLPPKLKAAFADKTEHFSEHEFGYYADLSSAHSVSEFKNKILTIVQIFGFSDFSFKRMHWGDIDSKLLVTRPHAGISRLNKKLKITHIPSDEVITNSSGVIFEYCARRSGNLEIVQRIKNMNDRLNHTRVCESRMEKAPVVPLIEITRQGVDGNYKDLQKLFDDQYSRSVMLLPHIMRQRILPVITVVEETLVKTLSLEAARSPKWPLLDTAVPISIYP